MNCCLLPYYTDLYCYNIRVTQYNKKSKLPHESVLYVMSNDERILNLLLFFLWHVSRSLPWPPGGLITPLK